MDYSTLSTAALMKIQGRSACGSAEERAVREELRRRGENQGASPIRRAGRKRQPLLFPKEVWAGTREKERI